MLSPSLSGSISDILFNFLLPYFSAGVFEGVVDEAFVYDLNY